MPVAKQDRKSNRIHHEEHEGHEEWNSIGRQIGLRLQIGLWMNFKAVKLERGINHFVVRLLRGESPVPLRVSSCFTLLCSSVSETDALSFRRHQQGKEDATMLVDEIKEFVEGISATLKEKRGAYSVKFTVAERRVFLSKKKLTYSAKFRVDEDKKELRFTEMLTESGSGISGGDSQIGPGFGFKKESYKTGAGPRSGLIEEQSRLFGKQYSYTFDFSKMRPSIEKLAANAGYAFKYQITSRGL